MKKVSLLKTLVVLLLSVVLIASLGTVVFADDNLSIGDDWDTPIAETDNTSAIDTSTETPAPTETTDESSTESENESTPSTSTSFSVENTRTNIDSSDETDDEEEEKENNTVVNSLAYTGIADNSPIAVAVVIGMIVATYSYKKINEYNSL